MDPLALRDMGERLDTFISAQGVGDRDAVMAVAHVVAAVLLRQLHRRHGRAVQSSLGDADPALAWPLADRVKGAVKGRRLLLAAADGVERHILQPGVGAGERCAILGL